MILILSAIRYIVTHAFVFVVIDRTGNTGGQNVWTLCLEAIGHEPIHFTRSYYIRGNNMFYIFTNYVLTRLVKSAYRLQQLPVSRTEPDYSVLSVLLIPDVNSDFKVYSLL